MSEPKQTTRRKRRKLVGRGVVLITAAAIATAAVGSSINPASSSGETAHPSVPAPSVAPTVAKVTKVDGALSKRLAVFRRPAASGDRLSTPSTPPASQGPTRFAGSTGANPGIARRAFASAIGAVYLVPSHKGLCLADSTGSQQFCATTGQVLSGDATASTDCSPMIPDNVVEISGVLPDGAKNPSLLMSDGSAQPLDVRGNAYLVRFQRKGALPRRIQWSAAGTKKSAPTVVPRDAATFKCHAAQLAGTPQSP